MTSRNRLTDPREQADLLLYRLYRVHTTAARLVVPLCEREYGLTRREWRVLSFLSEHEGALSSELADHAMLDRARTSRTLTRLDEKGLILREPRPSDRREVHVSLTEEGRQIATELFPKVAEINRTLMAGLSIAERKQLDSLLDRLQTQANALTSGD
jgi:DNA-binding MarR family transcriptional regulator